MYVLPVDDGLMNKLHDLNFKPICWSWAIKRIIIIAQVDSKLRMLLL